MSRFRLASAICRSGETPDLFSYEMSEEQSLRGQKGLEYFFNSGNINPMEVKIGTVSHVYKKIGVAIVELSEPLQAGDTIHISGHHTDLTQKVESMQAEHQNVQKAEPGQSVGLKVTGEVREHDLVYKVVD